ncbi:MAG: hypothetical protein N3E48_03045 [Candidatus Bathyarchaeota archaeon]|nr:hypothetical protein [Candidatus Bathyarchaeota archaeon]
MTGFLSVTERLIIIEEMLSRIEKKQEELLSVLTDIYNRLVDIERLIESEEQKK